MTPRFELAGYEYKAIDPADYALPQDASDDELVSLLADPLTRICNLYRITDKEADEVPFRPNWAQCVVLYAIYIAGEKRIAIPKARQLGFSTLCAIIALDTSLFGANAQCSIVDRTQKDASAKLGKCRFAWEKLPDALKAGEKLSADSNTDLAWEQNGGRICAGKNARGGEPNQILHISEWGPIAYNDPKRSQEIKSGALPTAEHGVIIGESTYMGGKGGDWYDVLRNGLDTPPAHRTRKDWRVLFFPWFLDQGNTLEGDTSQIDAETTEYLNKAEKRIGQPFTQGQRLWYFKELGIQKEDMKREHPTFLEEMWEVAMPGAIFAQYVDRQRAAGKITNDILWRESFPVYTAWDIGAALNTKVWVFQLIADRIVFLEALSGGPECETAAQWVKRLQDRPYGYGGHFLPHDGAVSWKAALEEAGMRNIVCLAKPVWIWEPIREAQAQFSRCEFNAECCEDGIDALDAYHSKTESDGVTLKDVPVHDWASHFSSAFCQAFSAIRQGQVIDRSAIPRKPLHTRHREKKLSKPSHRRAISRR